MRLGFTYMNFKGEISSLVLATTFGVGMASSGLASAQNGGGTAVLASER